MPQWLAVVISTGWAQVLVPVGGLILAGLAHSVYRLGKLTGKVEYLTRVIEWQAGGPLPPERGRRRR